MSVSTSWPGGIRVLAAVSALVVAAAAALAIGHPAHAATTFTVTGTADVGGPCDTTADTCPGLRAAIGQADSDSGDVISLPAGTYTITLGTLPPLQRDMTIMGTGAGSTRVDSGGSWDVFVVSPGASVTLNQLTIQNGSDPQQGGGIWNLGTLTLTDVVVSHNQVTGTGSSPAGGGGIFNEGTLTVNGGTFDNNKTSGSAFGGGGIFNKGTLTVNGATFDHNGVSGLADPAGGAILSVGAQSRATVDGTTFTNDQGQFGGAIGAFGPLTLRNATLRQDTAGVGAGVFVGPEFAICASRIPTPLLSTGTADVATTTFDSGSTGQLGGGLAIGGSLVNGGGSATITASTFKGNSAGNAGAGGAGGAVLNYGGTLSMLNDTLTTNVAVPPDAADAAAGAVAVGGAIAQLALGDIDSSVCNTPGGPLPFKLLDNNPGGVAANGSLDYLTIAGNTAMSSGGGGIFNHGTTQTTGTRLTVHDTIISGNAGKNCIAPAPMTSLGFNLEDASDCGFAASGDLTSSNPNLGALASNGGPTQTMALPSGSPAVDAGDTASTITSDQRGLPRNQGAQDPRSDIGAYELQVSATPPSSPAPSPGSPTQALSSLPAPPVTGQGPAASAGSGVLPVLAFLVAMALIAGAAFLRRRKTSA